MTITQDFDGIIRNHLYGKDISRFRKRRGQMKWLQRRVGMRVFMDAVQEFQLWRGDAPFGRKKVMSGREAWNANKDFEDAYAKTCVAHPERRLWKWRPVDSRPVREMCKKAAMELVV